MPDDYHQHYQPICTSVTNESHYIIIRPKPNYSQKLHSPSIIYDMIFALYHLHCNLDEREDIYIYRERERDDYHQHYQPICTSVTNESHYIIRPKPNYSQKLHRPSIIYDMIFALYHLHCNLNEREKIYIYIERE